VLFSSWPLPPVLGRHPDNYQTVTAQVHGAVLKVGKPTAVTAGNARHFADTVPADGYDQLPAGAVLINGQGDHG